MKVVGYLVNGEPWVELRGDRGAQRGVVFDNLTEREVYDLIRDLFLGLYEVVQMERRASREKGV